MWGHMYRYGMTKMHENTTEFSAAVNEILQKIRPGFKNIGLWCCTRNAQLVMGPSPIPAGRSFCFGVFVLLFNGGIS